MVANAQYIPDDPKEQASVLKVLREHPELQGDIERAQEAASRIFSKYRIWLDSRTYDEWDPPLTLYIGVNEPFDQFRQSADEYTDWLAYTSNYHRDLLLIMPTWEGPLESIR